MKKHIFLLSVLIPVMSMIFWQGCKDDDDDYSDEDKIAIETVERVQNQCGDVYEEYLQTMDTATAKNALALWFQSDTAVEWAEVTDQGISVQYKNGICGGIFMDPMDDAPVDTVSMNLSVGPVSAAEHEDLLKVIPTGKKVLFYNPHYIERKQLADKLIRNYKERLPKVGMQLAEENIYLNDKANLEVLTQLSGYGIIHFYSHGLAWPNKNNIQEVYLMTGQIISGQGALPYIADLRTKKIIYQYFDKTQKNQFFVSPAFITDKNDFSKDNVLIWGGFCYGFLGTWKNIVNKTAAGTYIGADWSVSTWYNANWADELIYNLTFKPHVQAVTVSDWFSFTTGLPKQYTDQQAGRIVKINYNGHGDMALWIKVNAEIHPVDAGGAPVTTAGRINTPYQFDCPVDGAEVDDLKFTWNFGDGSPEVEVLKDNTVTHMWENDGGFEMTVDVTDITTLELLVSDTVTVSIAPDMDLLSMLHTIKYIQLGLPSEHHYLSNGETIGIGGTYIYSNMLGDTSELNWNGTNFSVSGIDQSGWNLNIYGSVSSDGQTLISLFAHKWYPPPTQMPEITIELGNLAVTTVIPVIPSAAYYLSGSETQAHVTNFEYKKWDYNTQSWATYTHSDWEYVSIEVLFSGHNK
jgi:hypothetical protein